MPGAGPGGASPGTVKPLHAAALFPVKPCKQVCSARVIGSRGAGLLRSAALTHSDIGHLWLRGWPGHQRCPGGLGCPGTTPEPSGCTFPIGLCRPRVQEGQLLIFRQQPFWQPFLASVTRALLPLQLLIPWGTADSSPPKTQASISRTMSHGISAHSSAALIQPHRPHSSPESTSVTPMPQRLPPMSPSAPDQMHSFHRCLRRSSTMLFFFLIRAVYLKNIQFLFLIPTA